MGTLEEKVKHLEQQLNRILQHIGSPTGDLFASHEKVAALETLVQKQQIKLDLLEQTQVLFLQSVPQYLDEQVQQALQQRGSKGADFVAITKFVTGHLATAIVKLQEACFKTVHESLPLQAVQALEKKVQTSLQKSSAIPELHTLQTRLALLELQQPRQETNQPNERITQEHLQNKIQTQELTNMKEHIEHLETKLLAEVQKAYTTVHKPGEYGAPLARVQSLVTTLNNEFQSFRQMDVQKLAESIFVTAHQNLRTEFTAVLETCITKKEYSQFEAAIQRIEEYTKDFRGQLYKIKNECDTFKDEISENIQDVHLNIKVIMKGKNSIEHYLNQVQSTIRILNKQRDTIDEYIRELKKEKNGYYGKQADLFVPVPQLPHNPIQLPSPYKQATKVYQSITKCFYTAILGTEGQRIDELGSVDRIPGWDYICFTNQPYQKANGWTILPVEYTGKYPALEAKRYKWLSHEYLLDYDVVVWVDAYITPTLSMRHKLKEWILTMKEKRLYSLHRPHDTRKCIWDECDAVVKSRRDTEQNVNKVRKLLNKHSMPKGWGLFDTNILLRFHKHQIVQELGEAIFKHLSTMSIRDQLAVTFIYYSMNFRNFFVQDLFQAFEKNGTHIQNKV
jgi:hypothetical protein